MAMVKGDADCTSGLSKRIYDNWTGDSRSGLVNPLTGTARGCVRAMCYAIASAVVDEITTDAVTTPGGDTIT